MLERLLGVGEHVEALVDLLDTLRNISSSLERDPVIERTLAGLDRLLGPRVASLLLEHDGELTVVAHLVEGRVELRPHALASCRHAAPELVNAAARAGSAQVEGGRACVPVEHGDEHVGLLLVECEAPIAARIAVVEALARTLGQALDHAQARAAISESEARLWAILDNTNTVVFVKDLDGRYVLGNRRLELDTGMPRAQMLGKTDIELFDAETAARLRADDERVLVGGETIEREGVTEFPDGPRVFVTTKFPLRDQAGRIYAVCGVATDMTERRRFEEQARHGQKMDALGQLVGGVAHDFNNMLTGVLASAELLELELPEREPTIDESIRTILDAASHAAELTRKLMMFSREGHRPAEVVDVHEVVESTVGLLRRAIDRRIEVVVSLGARAPRIIGDATRLQTALLNLGVNARDAMPLGGTIEIATRDVELGEAECRDSPFRLAPGPFVEIEIRDTGVGIEESLLLRIFEPFYTTKEIGYGTGLGLAAVHGTVVEHGGSVGVTSKVGVGTRFVIALPRTEQPAARSEPEPRPSPGERGSILIVDDEPVVRKTAGRMLEMAGFAVVLAEDGVEGVERFVEHHAEIDLVLLDMVMPKMGGYEAYRAMQRIDAAVPVVVCSGYAADESVRALHQQGLAGFLAKPYRREQLLATIERTRRRRPS